MMKYCRKGSAIQPGRTRPYCQGSGGQFPAVLTGRGGVAGQFTIPAGGRRRYAACKTMLVTFNRATLLSQRVIIWALCLGFVASWSPCVPYAKQLVLVFGPQCRFHSRRAGWHARWKELKDIRNAAPCVRVQRKTLSMILRTFQLLVMWNVSHTSESSATAQCFFLHIQPYTSWCRDTYFW
eukprot:3957310-Amphidinium_carterae.1